MALNPDVIVGPYLAGEKVVDPEDTLGLYLLGRVKELKAKATVVGNNVNHLQDELQKAQVSLQGLVASFKTYGQDLAEHLVPTPVPKEPVQTAPKLEAVADPKPEAAADPSLKETVTKMIDEATPEKAKEVLQKIVSSAKDGAKS